MTRREAVALLVAALALVTAGVVWLWGPWGLIGAGVVLGVLVLTVVDVEGRARGEAVADAAPGQHFPVGRL